MKRHLLLKILLFIPLISISQKALIDLSIKQLKNNDLKSPLPVLNNKVIKNLFEFQIMYKNQGIINDSLILKTSLENINGELGVIANYSYGDYLIKRKTPNDSLAFYHYKLALKLSKKDTLLVNECLRRICDRLYLNGKDQNLFKYYVDEYDEWKNDNVDMFWVSFYQIAHKLQSSYETNKEKINIKNLNFNKGFKMAQSPYFNGVLHQLKGIYYNVFTSDFTNAEKEFKLAIYNYAKEPHYFSQSRIYDNKVNLGIAIFNQGKTNQSIKIFKEAMLNQVKYYSDKDKMYTSSWLNKAYKKINLIDSAYVYSELSNKLKEKIDKFNHSIAIKNIEEKINIVEKENKINELESSNDELSKNLNTLIPLFGFTTLILLLIFYLYKRYKKKSSILEEEQSETLQKLDELKNIVIKNHIVLKDKTKVYISDLMYIKSDDHYLGIVTQNYKKHTVRGKLSQIKEELPPNFIQCHRSYIVNSNFIKQVNATSLVLINKEQIPLSRSYKDKF